MGTAKIARSIEEFFDDHSVAGLILPNGWFGRPYDSFHRLSACTVEDDTMRVELDGRLNLSFAGDRLVAVSGRDGLTVRGYDTVAWDWHPYDTLDQHHEVFSAGEVTFVILPD